MEDKNPERKHDHRNLSNFKQTLIKSILLFKASISYLRFP